MLPDFVVSGEFMTQSCDTDGRDKQSTATWRRVCGIHLPENILTFGRSAGGWHCTTFKSGRSIYAMLRWMHAMPFCLWPCFHRHQMSNVWCKHIIWQSHTRKNVEPLLTCDVYSKCTAAHAVLLWERRACSQPGKNLHYCSCTVHAPKVCSNFAAAHCSKEQSLQMVGRAGAAGFDCEHGPAELSATS